MLNIKIYSIDVGYNLWVRTCEGFLNNRRNNDLCSLGSQPTLFDESQMNTWALKGDANMFGYATDLRSITQGRATFTLQFSRYSPVPHSVSEEILSELKRVA